MLIINHGIWHALEALDTLDDRDMQTMRTLPHILTGKLDMRILLIEDDPSTAKFVEVMLNSEGFVCDTANSGEEGIEIGKIYDYNVILLDLMLPDMEGYEVLRQLRAAKVSTPVLILSALGKPENKIKGLDIGADDYLAKPFDKRELVARIYALARRAYGHTHPVIDIGNVTLNLGTRQVTADGRTVHLTGKEYAILELLSMRKGIVMTKQLIFDHLYGGIDEPQLKIIDVFVCKLRKKLAQAADGESCIETVWGRGYVMQEPPKAYSPDEMKSAA
jgi:two-component system cell cycle response regulator CtrA